MLLIRGKGGKERMVPLAAPAREALRLWLATREGRRTAARRAGQASLAPSCFPRAARRAT